MEAEVLMRKVALVMQKVFSITAVWRVVGEVYHRGTEKMQNRS
jgi:hypothetical protein